MLFVKGAPEIVLEMCRLSKAERRQWLVRVERWGKNGLRMVGLAGKGNGREDGSRREIGKMRQARLPDGQEEIMELDWYGLIGFSDPVRPGVSAALCQARRAGIDVKVITGDYKATAEAVLRKLNISIKDDEVMEGEELRRLSKEELQKRINKIKLFSRTSPAQKHTIVEALKEKLEIVAMTGDGVNDAPALKRADIGIVVEGASDVSKQTADMVLLDNNFQTIVAAIEEGRAIFANLRKIILYLLSDSFSEVFLVLFSLVFGLPLPLTAAQILFVNLVTDGFPSLALTVEPKDRNLLKLAPRKPQTHLLNQEIKALILLISLSTAVLTLLGFWWFLRQSHDLALARSVAFMMLAVDSLLYVFSCRSLKKPLWRDNIFSNGWLILAVLAGFALQVLALYFRPIASFLNVKPLGIIEWLVVLLEAAVVIGLIEGTKWIFNKRY